MKKVRITASTFACSCFFTLWYDQFHIGERDTERNARKSHRGKKTETGGSDPTFLRPSRPKSLVGSLPPSGARKPCRSFFHGDGTLDDLIHAATSHKEGTQGRIKRAMRIVSHV